MRTSRASALSTLFDEVVATFHHLRAAAERIHGQGPLTSGRRGVLRGLAGLGPQTVPQMARARPVSRQYIQSIVDGLRGDGLVALRPNPAHRSSPLVEITAKGTARLRSMEGRERELVSALARGQRRSDVEAATATLRLVRRALAARPAAGPSHRDLKMEERR
jgi:DNA-binding MarR family transcriptional regulator